MNKSTTELSKIDILSISIVSVLTLSWFLIMLSGPLYFFQ